MNNIMNILIFEDEIYNYHLLCDMLDRILPLCHFLGPLSSITEGKNFFATNKNPIDIIIADIHLNDGLSFVALSDAPSDVPIIFTTAYDEYALKAFEYNSLSYLLKPVDEDELREAIRKSQERLITDVHRQELFLNLSAHPEYRERFVVNTFRGEQVVNVSQIRYIFSEQKNTFIRLHDGTSLAIDASLTSLAAQLNPKDFMRVNRQYIVPVREVESIEHGINGKSRLILRGDNPPTVSISRDNRHNVLEWLK